MWVLHGLDARTTFTIVTLSFAAAVKLVEDFTRAGDAPMTFIIDQVADTGRPKTRRRPDQP